MRVTSEQLGKGNKAVVLLAKSVSLVFLNGEDEFTHADASSQTLLTALKTKVKADSVAYTDSLSSYIIVDISGLNHHRVNHSKHFVEGRDNHINGIENFWNQPKRILIKYNTIPPKTLPTIPQKGEFRFNYGSPKQ